LPDVVVRNYRAKQTVFLVGICFKRNTKRGKDPVSSFIAMPGQFNEFSYLHANPDVALFQKELLLNERRNTGRNFSQGPFCSGHILKEIFESFLSAFVSLLLKARHETCVLFFRGCSENDLFVNESLSKMTERALRGIEQQSDKKE
jgi:hypothetical protein